MYWLRKTSTCIFLTGNLFLAGCLGGYHYLPPILSLLFAHKSKHARGNHSSPTLALFSISYFPSPKRVNGHSRFRGWQLYFLFSHPQESQWGVYGGICHFLENRLGPVASPRHFPCNYFASFRCRFEQSQESIKCSVPEESQNFLSTALLTRTSLRQTEVSPAGLRKQANVLLCCKLFAKKCSERKREREGALPPSKNESAMKMKCNVRVNMLIQICTLYPDLPSPHLLGSGFYAWKIQPTPNSISLPHPLPIKTEASPLDRCEFLVL